MVKDSNKKKIATIKRKVFDSMFSKAAEDDKEFADALKLVGDALIVVEKKYGSMD